MAVLGCDANRTRLRPGPVIACIVVVGLVAGDPCLAADPQRLADEYQVKAAFIFNFIKFVDWPSGVFQSPADPFVICVVGSDPFGHSLEDTVANHVVGGRMLSVRHISGLTQVAGCHVLFVGLPADVQHAVALAGLASPGILTIGDSGESAAAGAMIRFRLDGGKVRFEIDAGAAERMGLRISSRLLNLAVVPDQGRRRP